MPQQSLTKPAIKKSRTAAGRTSSKGMTSIALEIVKKAAGADPPTIEWVRTQYEVTERQAFRYLQHVKEAGVDLVAERQADGRTVYRVPASVYFKPEQLSVPEAIATAVLTQALLGQPLQPDTNTARSGVDKIHRALDERVAERIRHLQDRLSVRMVQAERPAQPKVFNTLVEAILGDVTVRVEYGSPYLGRQPKADKPAARAAKSAGAGASSARRIETFELQPYALVFARRSWYLVARRVDIGEIRTYKLGRISHVATTSNRFVMPRDFDVDSHLGNAWELVPDAKARSLAVELVFDASFAGAIADTRWHRTQKLTRLPDGSLRFQAKVDGTQEILWWILGMGSHVKVVGPPALVQAVREETARMHAVHAGGTRRRK
ncbi:MAG: WYL domain-containing protein [Phycisphaerae bacterium]|nr:WYL domain-containing protein [Phycisphaerae bacterium]